MPRHFGSDRSIYRANKVAMTDVAGVPMLSTSNEYDTSPLGPALLNQVRLGLPNATFNLLPPDPYSQIAENENPLPYWRLQSTPDISVTPLYDSTTQTWGINVNPGTAPSGDVMTLTTRSFVQNDDNLSLRQKASLILAKTGTYAGTSQWNLTLTATYYDATDTAVSTAVVGTVYDNTTWTSIAGTTTTGGSAIPASAEWAEFQIKLTATANITSSTGVTIKSLILASSSPLTAGLVVTDVFTASGTWNRPTGVTSLLAVVGVGGGGGGAGGQARSAPLLATAGTATGGPSGGSSAWAYIKDLYVGDVTSISVGVGTAGVGGTATVFSKAAAGTAQLIASQTGGSGGAGGATTFGTYLTIPGGGGGTAQTSSGNTGGGTAAGAPTSTVYGLATLSAVAGTVQLSTPAASNAAIYSQLPYWSQPFVAGATGGTATGTGGANVSNGNGAAGGSAGIIGAGGGGGRGILSGAGAASTGAAGSAAAGGGGGGGGAGARYSNATVTIAGTAGNGGNAAANSGSGGGGGGGIYIATETLVQYNASTMSVTSGAGGNGGAGLCLVVYVAG